MAGRRTLIGRRIGPLTLDQDLNSAFKVWMEQNGFQDGETISAVKALLRLGMTHDPITAHLAEAKQRIQSYCLRDFNVRIHQFLKILADEYRQSIRNTSPEEINIE